MLTAEVQVSENIQYGVANDSWSISKQEYSFVGVVK